MEQHISRTSLVNENLVHPPICNGSSYDYRVILIRIVDKEIYVRERDGWLWAERQVID